MILSSVVGLALGARINVSIYRLVQTRINSFLCKTMFITGYSEQLKQVNKYQWASENNNIITSEMKMLEVDNKYRTPTYNKLFTQNLIGVGIGGLTSYCISLPALATIFSLNVSGLVAVGTLQMYTQTCGQYCDDYVLVSAMSGVGSALLMVSGFVSVIPIMVTYKLLSSGLPCFIFRMSNVQIRHSLESYTKTHN